MRNAVTASIVRRPDLILALAMIASAVVWVTAPTLSRLSPPLDVLEGYMWGREWALVTYKHPAMPAWLIEASRIVTFGAIGWPVYVLSQLFIAANVAIVYRLGADLMDIPRGALAGLSMLVFEHLSWRSPEFNHTITALPFWAAIVLFTWRVTTAPTALAWAALGGLGALGLYTKLSHGLILAAAFGWLVFNPEARSRWQTPARFARGPVLAGAIFFLVVTPLLLWLWRNGFQPLDYAYGRASKWRGDSLSFLIEMIVISAPTAGVLAIAGAFAKTAPAAIYVVDRASQKRTFAAVMILAPLLFGLGFAVAQGNGPKTSWFAPMLAVLPILVLLWCPARLNLTHVHRGAIAVGGFLIIAPIASASWFLLAPERAAGPSRGNWPEQAIAKAAARAWHAQTNAPLRFVIGDAWSAGLVGVRHPDRPSIVTEGDLRLSPWVTLDRLKRDGAIVVFEPRRERSGPLTQLIAGRTPQPLVLEAQPRRARNVQLQYVILSPAWAD
jgi:4-amino-4-deoxy-L-arabinose transferase-like glycosyltransferase